jgi:VWFA-related protein
MALWKLQIIGVFLATYACAQSVVAPQPVMSPSSNHQPFMPTIGDQFSALGYLWMLRGEGSGNLENATDSVSKLDLKAPGKARREYEKGVVLLLKKNFDSAVERLTESIAVYSSFVAAHNALGSVYLEQGQNEQARKEFAQAVMLDDHLPNSHLNLGRAELALKDYAAAEGSIQKASALAPLDLRLLTALTYAQFLNRDYGAAIATAQQVHGRKHKDAGIVHYFAAAAWQGQNNLPEMERELKTFLDEDPKSPIADTARDFVAQIDHKRIPPSAATVEIAYSATPGDSNQAPGAVPATARRVFQELEEERQVREAETECDTCSPPAPTAPLSPDMPPSTLIAGSDAAGRSSSPWTLRSTVNEVALFFAATDRGKSVSDLSRKEVVIRDDGVPPAAVIAFRNESQLPLRLGLVIDTSASITREFSFEQTAAASFLQKAVTDKDDLAFVVGFSGEVLLVQDFTRDMTRIFHGIDQLAPAGGTALWDAVKFASDKLASRPEKQPVARILVVISDGDDNASTATLKQAIENAEREEVIIYTVSTREFAGGNASPLVADQAMKALAERTGGAAFVPNSLGNLDRRLADLQQVIRGRYLISYKPAHFEADGRYRAIAIEVQKSGHKLHIYARRGYYAHARPSVEGHF